MSGRRAARGDPQLALYQIDSVTVLSRDAHLNARIHLDE